MLIYKESEYQNFSDEYLEKLKTLIAQNSVFRIEKGLGASGVDSKKQNPFQRRCHLEQILRQQERTRTCRFNERFEVALASSTTGTSVLLLRSVSCRSMAAYQETQMYRVGNRATEGHGAGLQNLEGCGQSNGAKTTVLYLPPNL